jgi:predicted DNA-binding transcriptional regulator AlpA
MAIDPNDRLVGVEEVAQILGVHPVTIFHKIGKNPKRRDERFPEPIRSLGRRLRWRLSTIHKYIALHERGKPA